MKIGDFVIPNKPHDPCFNVLGEVIKIGTVQHSYGLLIKIRIPIDGPWMRYRWYRQKDLTEV